MRDADGYLFHRNNPSGMGHLVIVLVLTDVLLHHDNHR